MIDLRTLAPFEKPQPGFYRMNAGVYFADPCPEPSLSSSIANALLDGTPRHAWTKHPRLNIDQPEESDASRPKEIGTAAHKVLLGEGRSVFVIDANDYKKGEAKDQRAKAYEEGLAPILRDDMKAVDAMVSAAREQMAMVTLSDGTNLLEEFEAAQSEVVMMARDVTGPWLRSMCDKLLIRDGRAKIFDLKTSGTEIAPAGLGWKIAGMGYEVQAGFYERLLSQLMPELAGRIEFIHVWLEVDAPHALIASELDGCGKDVGSRKTAAAISLWDACLTAGKQREAWPLYPGSLYRVEYPNRAESDWLAREMSDERIAAAIAADPFISACGTSRARPASDDTRVIEEGFA